jgi:hypothetical protein
MACRLVVFRLGCGGMWSGLCRREVWQWKLLEKGRDAVYFGSVLVGRVNMDWEVWRG